MTRHYSPSRREAYRNAEARRKERTISRTNARKAKGMTR